MGGACATGVVWKMLVVLLSKTIAQILSKIFPNAKKYHHLVQNSRNVQEFGCILETLKTGKFQNSIQSMSWSLVF
jgi:hypothetical protein